MSEWNDVSKFKGTPSHVNTNLNQLPTVSDQVPASSKGSVIPKAGIAVISTALGLSFIAVVMIPIILSLTHTGFFSTVNSNTSSASTASTTPATTTGSTTVTTTASTIVTTTASTIVTTTGSTTVVTTTASTTVTTTASTIVTTTGSTTVVTTTVSTIVTTTGSTTVTTTASTTVATTTGASQCSSYTTISDATRLATAAGGTVCDSLTFTTSVTWVRFTSPGGTQLITSAVSTNQCDTQATGWYSGSLPSSGVTANGTVCYAWNSNTCNWSNNIQVTNCGAFYVYGLIQPAVCNARYCTQ